MLTMDGTTYRLESEAQAPYTNNGRMMLQTNVETPLAQWVDRMFAALEPCWRARE
jgi:hypothetical protein